jgi:long-chain acyl-CoA synthetase
VNLAAVLDPHPDDAVALVTRGRPVTYGQLRREVGVLRGAFAQLGLEPGERVAIVAHNNLTFVVPYLAALGAGCVAVPLNPTSPPAELQRQLAAVTAAAVVVGPGAAGAIAGVDRAAAGLRLVLAPRGAELDDVQVLDDLLSAEPAPVADRAGDDLAVLMFTAGTAGSPRPAMLTHGNLRANIEQVQRVPSRRLEPGDVSLGVLPLFHIFGLNVVLGLSLAAGSSVVLVERFDPSSALDTIRDRGVTVVAGAPPVWTAWSSLPDAPADVFASVRVAVSGASRLSRETADAMLRRYGVRVTEGYGLTEAAPIVTTSGTEDTPPGSVGRPLPGVELRLVDEQGEDALVGDPGEIRVRGPNVFAGYWGDEEASARALTLDGWLCTGDIAVSDDRGYIYLVDRAKDLVIVSGFNVFPAEVEEVLVSHPGVAAVAVVGVPHPHTGEAVKAIVVPVEGHLLDEEALIAHCGTHLARYKCPTKVQFVDALPQGLGGKVLRRQLG